jgi:hypothetical protein
MLSVDQAVRVYQELANWHVQMGQAQMRDRFLVLAADALHTAGREEAAEQVRIRLLQINPHHLFKPYGSLAEAMRSPDVRNYIEGLRRTYPPDKAAHLLESLRSGKDEAGEKKGPLEPEPPAKNAASPAAADNLRVYRVQDAEARPSPERQPSRPRPREVEHPPRAESESPMGAGIPLTRPSAPVARPASSPPMWSDAAPPSPWRRESPELEQPEPAGGAWLGTSLFWLVLAVGIALAVYTLGGPFLPL